MHPTSHSDQCFLPPPYRSCPTEWFNDEQMLTVIKSYRLSSCVGIDRPRPGYPSDPVTMSTVEPMARIGSAIQRFSNGC